MAQVTGPIADAREPGIMPLDAAGTPNVVLHNVGVAISELDPDQAVGIQSVDAVMSVEEERYVYAIDFSDDYVRGFRDGVDSLYRAGSAPAAAAAPAPQALGSSFEESQTTWGLQALKVLASRASGAGVRVAVLDTGLDLLHPDFVTRPPVAMQSFVPGVASVQDGHGHGTHCAGTINGPAAPGIGPRYGVAPHASLLVGKVLSDFGFGRDGEILAGINWAIGEKCDIISLSIGSPVVLNAPPSKAYEQAAQAALDQGMLIVAAAGNESRRPFKIAPVGHPANCPSIFAVAAVDDNFRIAYFSCGQAGSGKAPDISGPGVQVHSSWRLPRGYNMLSGTSMAAPHVAGAAALFVEAQNVRGRALADALKAGARTIAVQALDAGAGLVQAP